MSEQAALQHLVRRLALPNPDKAAAVVAKALEYVRVSTARLGAGGLGQGELCKGAACVALACQTLGVTVNASLVQRHSGAGDKLYSNTKATLQKVLNVGTKASPRELCIQFGCTRHEPSVRACLAAYKERFARSLPPAQQRHVDFTRAAFLAAAFYCVARKHKVSVDRLKLLGQLGVTASEFAQVTASMADLCHDLVGVEPRKRKAEDLPEEQRALVERTGLVAGGEEASDSEDEVEDENMVGYRLNPKKQRQQDYEAWKGQMQADKAAQKQQRTKKQEQLTEKRLKQAVLAFAAAPTTAATAAGGAGSSSGKEQEEQEEAAQPKQQQQQSAGGGGSGKDKGRTPGKAAANKGGGGKVGRTPAKKAALASKNG